MFKQQQGSLSTRDFETRTASGSELFSLITRLHTITFTLLSTVSSLGMITVKIWETPLSWHAKCSLPLAVCVSKRRMLKLTITSNMKRPTCGASRTTFYPFLELLYVCVVSSIVSLSNYRPYREGCRGPFLESPENLSGPKSHS